MRILIVDDEPTFLEVVETSLRQKGLDDLTFAESAADALRVISAQEVPFDCVLLDILMPEVNGIELCEILRRKREYQATPIIMITASQAVENMDLAFDAGATDFLRKPLDDADLTGRIYTAMLLVEATRKARQSREALSSVFNLSSDYHCIDVSNRICFPDADGMLDYFQLENKCLQLKEGSYITTLFRLDLRDLLTGKDSFQHPNALRLLHSFSRDLGHVQTEKPLWYSYIGGGRFICCIVGRLPAQATPLPQQLEKLIHHTSEQARYLELDAVEPKITHLNAQSIISKEALLSLVRREYRLAASSALDWLPTVSQVEDNIFA